MSLPLGTSLSDLILNDWSYGVVLAERAGTSYALDNRNIARVSKGRLLGGVVYSSYTGESIAMHTASWNQHWVSRDLLWIAFDYPYNQLHVRRIFGQVPADNWRARRFNEHLGFTVVAEIEGVYKGGVACLVMKQERHECRFLSLKPRWIKSNVVDEEAPDDGREG